MKVVVYTKPEIAGEPKCQPCRATKKKFDQLDIPYTEILLDDTNRDYVLSLGHIGAPVVEADYGEGVTTSWSGYRPDLIKQLSDTR